MGLSLDTLNPVVSPFRKDINDNYMDKVVYQVIAGFIPNNNLIIANTDFTVFPTQKIFADIRGDNLRFFVKLQAPN